ncbi:MAG: biotin/lipoyl-containing protein [Caldilinea sp.]
MNQFVAVYLPQSSPNDVAATLVEWTKVTGHWVNRGEIVAVAETTKSVFDIEAPQAGYFYPLIESGNEAAVGAVIAAVSQVEASLADAQAWLSSQQTPPVRDTSNAAGALVAGAKHATKKAELLARREHIDLTQVPATGERITEADVLTYIVGEAMGNGQRVAPVPPTSRSQDPTTQPGDLVDDRYPTNRVQRILIIGGGNGAVQIIDALARIPTQRAVAIMDDNTVLHDKRVAGVPVIGAVDAEHAVNLLTTGEFDAAVISVSTSIHFRERIFTTWKAQGIPFANVLHPSAVVGINVAMGEGNVVMAFCHFGACAAVGDNNFLSAYCSVEHHCVLGSHCSFGPGVVTSSRVCISDRVRFGTGIFIEPGVVIGADSVIASGLAIWQHIPERSLLKAKVGYTMRRLS